MFDGDLLYREIIIIVGRIICILLGIYIRVKNNIGFGKI